MRADKPVDHPDSSTVDLRYHLQNRKFLLQLMFSQCYEKVKLVKIMKKPTKCGLRFVVNAD